MGYVKHQAQNGDAIKRDLVLVSRRGKLVCKIDRKLFRIRPVNLNVKVAIGS